MTVDSCRVHSRKESFDRELAASMILSSPSVRTAVPLFTVLSTPASLPRSGRKIRMQCWEVASRSETSFTVRHLESLFAHFQCLDSQHPVLQKNLQILKSIISFANSPPTHQKLLLSGIFSAKLRQSFLLQTEVLQSCHLSHRLHLEAELRFLCILDVLIG